jgi:hypothetical protein
MELTGLLPFILMVAVTRGTKLTNAAKNNTTAAPLIQLAQKGNNNARSFD